MRPWAVVGLFAAAGLTNLTKGIGFGPLMVFIPVSAFILFTGRLSVIRRYLWAWGVILFLLLGLWWPLAITLEVPGAIELWLYDLVGRTSGDYALMSKPFWYYAVALLQVNAPWILLAPVAFAATWRTALSNRESPERFLWVWAFSIPVVLSFFLVNIIIICCTASRPGPCSLPWASSRSPLASRRFADLRELQRPYSLACSQ